MKDARRIVVALAPWAGLLVGLIAFSIVHQYGSGGSFNQCHAVSPGPLLLVAIVGLIACGASGYVSWRTMRGSGGDKRSVVAIISVGMAALFIFAIVLAMIAALVLPPCFQ